MTEALTPAGMAQTLPAHPAGGSPRGADGQRHPARTEIRIRRRSHDLAGAVGRAAVHQDVRVPEALLVGRAADDGSGW